MFTASRLSRLADFGSWGTGEPTLGPAQLPEAGSLPTNRLGANSSSDILFIFERLEISFIVKPLDFSILPQNHFSENSVGLPITLVGDLGMTLNSRFVTCDLKGCLSSSPWSDVLERSNGAVYLWGGLDRRWTGQLPGL